MILADTSVWVDHLRRSNASLVHLLEEGSILCHPFVIGEIALGRLSRRSHVLELLGALPAAAIASHDDVITLIEARRLFGRGIGWVDAHLIGAALVARVQLWTHDRRLASVAADLKIGFSHGRG